MISTLQAIVASACVILGTVPAFAATPLRVRGTIATVATGHVTVRDQDGRSFELRMGSYTRYAEVIPSSLAAVKVNDFIGTAVKGPRGRWVAVEIVIVPANMRAGRKGCYLWDPLPDTSGVLSPGTSAAGTVGGSVSNASPPTPALTETSMTNGSVTALTADQAGRVFTVRLVGDEAARIAASASVPVTRFVQADRSILSAGSDAVVWTGPGSKAVLIAVGKGVRPPM